MREGVGEQTGNGVRGLNGKESIVGVVQKQTARLLQSLGLPPWVWAGSGGR